MSQLTRFQRLFRGRENCYGQYLQFDDGSKKAWTVSQPVSDQEWENHLTGEGPCLGSVPITLDNVCYFGAIDLDDDGIDHDEVTEKVKTLDLPLVVCRSKSGAAHLYLFLKDPAPAKLVVEKLTTWAKVMGYEANSDGRPVEIFPKQKRLRETEVGNWINLPYYRGENTDRYAIHDGQHLSLDGFLDLAETTKISSSHLAGIQAVNLDDPFMDGPPCLQQLHQIGYPAGSRNQGLYNVGCFYKLAFPDDWEQHVRDYNADRMDPPLPDRELSDLIRSISRRDYVYKCAELPIAPYCKKTECKKRKFGIKGFQTKKDRDNFPVMENLIKIMTDPPRWQLDIDNETIDVTTEDLMSLVRFRKVVLEKLSKVIPMLKSGDWDDKIRELLEDHTVQEAPEDAGTLGQFTMLVGEFTALRRKADSREDLLRGLPYEEEGKVYFRSHDLLAFLERRKFRDYTMSNIYMVLRKMGAGSHQFNLKGACVRAWWIPAPEGEQSEPFETPTAPEPEF